MVEHSAPPWGEALTVLRLIRGWNKARLAKAAGVSVSAISRYEGSSRTASRDVERRLLAAMRFPPHLLDRTLAFIESVRAAREARLAAGVGALAARIDLVVGEAGLWIEELTRDVLGEALAVAGAREIRRQDLPPLPRVAEAAAPFPTAALPRAPLRSRRLPLGEALVILRVLRGWERLELARAVGRPARTIQNYEIGKSRPPVPTLKGLVEAMGYPFAVFDRTVAFVESARAASRLFLGAGEDALRAQAEQIAAGKARAVEEFARRQLDELSFAVLLLASRQTAPRLWALLGGCSEKTRWTLVRELTEFHTAGFCELLCDESLRAAGDSAERALGLAELAVEVAGKVAGPEGLRSRLQGYCGVHLANSRRVRGDDLRAAEQAFERALRLWDAGAADDPGLFNAARVLHLQASLYRALRRLPEALALLDEALTIDRWGETPGLVLGKARALAELGELEASIDLLRQAASLIDGERQPRQRFIAIAQLVWNLCHLGQHVNAELLLPELEALAAKLGNRLDRLRADWLRGIAAAGLGRMGEAISILKRVRAEFLALDNSYDAALVTLELAEVHATLGETAEVKALARESAPAFTAQGVHREARRALELFRRAAEEERASPELVRPIVAYLYRARHDPRLRFQEAA
jgi:transcriptional regulator with XRE-family HTH domain